MSTNAITIDALRKSYGGLEIIPGLSVHIEGGQFTVILGPSGCGKSTLLNILAGLESVSSGTIRIGDREVQDLAPKDRGCAMVFQNYALYPHMTVRDNIGYGLKVARVPKSERDRRVRETAKTVDLGDYLDRRPGALSGGQRQRVAIARAIVRMPQVMLFDEPLSNLDAKLRHEMRMELSRLHKQIGATSVFVTHDQVEAMTLADNILLLNQGKIEQYGTPADIYDHPASTFVAGFIGSPPMNLIQVEGVEAGAVLRDGTQVGNIRHKGKLTLGIRPEHIAIVEDGIPLRSIYAEDLGPYSVVVAALPDGQEIRLTTTLGTRGTVPGSFRVAFRQDAVRYFDRETGIRLAARHGRIR